MAKYAKYLDYAIQISNEDTLVVDFLITNKFNKLYNEGTLDIIDMYIDRDDTCSDKWKNIKDNISYISDDNVYRSPNVYLSYADNDQKYTKV